MRGIYNSVTDIRRKVFTEIARLAYEGGDYAKKIEELPYKILPGHKASYRNSILSWSVRSSESVCVWGSDFLCVQWRNSPPLSDGH